MIYVFMTLFFIILKESKEILKDWGLNRPFFYAYFLPLQKTTSKKHAIITQKRLLFAHYK